MTGHDKPRGRRRRLSEDEHTLWRGVTRSVAPLKRKTHLHLAEALEAGAADRKAKSASSQRARATASTPPQAPLAAKPARPGAGRAPSAPPLPLVAFDRRLKQRLARGTEEITASIDLHGRTQIEAHAALLQFLGRAQGKGAKTVLVITGKGGGPIGAGGERGVLKKQVPQWLGLPEFRAYVAGVEEAHGAHGGPGALYVRLRRARAGA